MFCASYNDKQGQQNGGCCSEEIKNDPPRRGFLSTGGLRATDRTKYGQWSRPLIRDLHTRVIRLISLLPRENGAAFPGLLSIWQQIFTNDDADDDERQPTLCGGGNYVRNPPPAGLLLGEVNFDYDWRVVRVEF